MADRLNPAEQTAVESDYQKKFNQRLTKTSADKSNHDLKSQEAAGDTSWKTITKKKQSNQKQTKGKFGFAGRKGGKVRHASAFVFIFAMLGLGVWYTSVFAPNILLVNIKEMYTNDLADATIALDTYYKKMMNYKIGRAQCGEQKSIKCKLSTMSRSQKQAFEKRGFTVIGSKVTEDMRDDGQEGNETPEESRYQVTAIIPPIQSPGLIATGDMLWAYAQLSSANKALVYGVFNPKSSFFMDARYKQRIKSKYNMTKSVAVGGATEQQVNKSFDNAVRNGGGMDIYGRPDPQTGISLGSLSNPVTLAQLQTAARSATLVSNSYTQLMCNWYSFGKSVTNNAKSAKSATIARFAMQYLKAADAIKAGVAEEIPTNVLSSKLAASVTGSYGGQNATDASIYKSIVYGGMPIPTPIEYVYNLNTFDLILAMTPAWSQIMTGAAGLAGVTGAPGTLAMPPANLTNSDRQYCLSGETTVNKTTVKGENSNSTRCPAAIGAMVPVGSQALVSDAIEVGRRTCPPVNLHDDNPIQAFLGTWRGPVSDVMIPSTQIVNQQITPVIAGLFGVNVMAWANVMQLLFTSQTKGVAASSALFAGTGEILGDMAMSRGMMPSNAAFMTEYLAQKDKVQNDLDEVARYEARKDPFDPYNKFSFIGSIAHSLSPTYNDKAPLLASLTNSISLLGSGLKKLNPSADAIYYSQPNPFNPLRLNCPDPEYLAIGIMADTACNVRYSFTRLELAAQIDSVLDYMLKPHPDAYQPQIDELTQRQGQADKEGDQANVGRQLGLVTAVANQPYIDRITGKAIPNSEYDKYLQYCVNRQDPWGRSAMHVQYTGLPDDVKEYMSGGKDQDGKPISTQDRGDPNQKVPVFGFPSIMEGALSDQDWYTGKKCTEQSEMLTNFRAYTMACSVDGSFSGGVDCTERDNSGSYVDDFYLHNDILYTSWH